MGVALISGESLTPQEAAFVRGIAKLGLAPEAAAAEAGFPGREAGWLLLRRRRVAHAIHVELQRTLTVELAPLSLRVLRKLLEDERTPARTRADIGRHLLQMAGFGRDTAGAAPEKPLSEMSADEIRTYLARNQEEISKLEGELASRAKDVSAPIAHQPAAKSLSFLD